MKSALALITLAASLAVLTPAAAQCFADYKAKQDNPLRLQYGLIALPAEACVSHDAAARYAAPVIARTGWTLLQIESILDETEFQRRRAQAGAVHLRQ